MPGAVSRFSALLKRICIYAPALVACLILAGCGTPAETDTPGPFPSGHSTNESLDFRTALDAMASDELDIHWLEDDDKAELGVLIRVRSMLTPRIVAFPRDGVAITQIMEDPATRLVIGSGFISAAHARVPVGLLKVQDVQLSPLEPYGYTRILGFNDSGAGVVHRGSYEQDMFSSAFQAGPGIIENGLLDISERDLQRPQYYRSFVALCADGLSVGISTRPTHLRTLGQVLVDFFARNNLDCPEVVNLAGDRQAVLAVKTGTGNEFTFHGDIENHKVTLLSFER